MGDDGSGEDVASTSCSGDLALRPASINQSISKFLEWPK